MNDLIRPALYQAHHEIVAVVPPKSRRKITADIVGPVCETGDFFARDREITAVRPGDLLAILDAGAYGHALASNYNSRPRPAEVLVAGKRTRLIRRRESTSDMLASESH
jgi:diaminopimelate decarboxylase